MKNILIVDDDEDLLFCYRIILEKEGRNVHTATDVPEALEVIQLHKIDIAILDFMLPKITGDKLAEKIFEQDPEVKIVFISGYDEAVEAVKKLDIKVYGVIRKPVEPELLERFVKMDSDEDLVPDFVDLPAQNLYSSI